MGCSKLVFMSEVGVQASRYEQEIDNRSIRSVSDTSDFPTYADIICLIVMPEIVLVSSGYLPKACSTRQ